MQDIVHHKWFSIFCTVWTGVSKLCHHDIVAEELKEQASEQFEMLPCHRQRAITPVYSEHVQTCYGFLK